MNRTRRLARHLVLLPFALACLAITSHTFLFLYGDYQADNAFHQSFVTAGWSVPLHFLGAGLALLMAPIQISSTLRRRWPRLHRLTGWLYVLAVGVGGTAGMLLATRAQGGWSTGSSFVLLGALWITATAIALKHVIAGRIEAHRRWMLRSIALTFSGVSLRIYLPVGIVGFGWPFSTSYLVAAWACWTINALLMELYLWRDASSEKISESRIDPPVPATS